MIVASIFMQVVIGALIVAHSDTWRWRLFGIAVMLLAGPTAFLVCGVKL